jgi:hypothetical protein
VVGKRIGGICDDENRPVPGGGMPIALVAVAHIVPGEAAP